MTTTKKPAAAPQQQAPRQALQSIDQFRGALSKMRPEFAAALPTQVKPEKFERVVNTAVGLQPGLLSADRRSLFASCMRAAQDGLLPDGREAALVVYGQTVQYMPMVAGIMKKVRQSKEIKNWSVHTVREADTFDYELGDDEKIVHKPARGHRGDVIGAYSIVTLTSGEKSREYMDVGEIEAVRARSRAKDKGPWVTDYSEMCKKTVIRRHAKRLPMSTDLDEFIRQDDELTELEPAPAEVTQDAPARPTRLASVMDAADEDDQPPLDVVAESEAVDQAFDDDAPTPGGI